LNFAVKWLGHASFQINVDSKVIYVDPYEGTYEDKADIVLVSHSHFDHCDPSKIEKILKKDTVIICPAVEAVHAYNYKRFRSPGQPFHPKGSGHAGDTDFIPEMKELKSIDLALLPSGGTYTMDNAEAAEAALAIKPKFVIPMHRWNSDPSIMKRKVEAESDVKVVLLQPGETFKLK